MGGSQPLAGSPLQKPEPEAAVDLVGLSREEIRPASLERRFVASSTGNVLMGWPAAKYPYSNDGFGVMLHLSLYPRRQISGWKEEFERWPCLTIINV